MRPIVTRAASIALATAVVLGAAACGNDEASGSSEGETNNSAELTEAKAAVDSLLANEPLELEPLSETPPSDYEVASVTCNINACYPGELERAAESLGWTVSEQTYDLADGPSAFVSAVQRALQSGPDALAILFVYPPETIQDEIDQAVADGVFLVDLGSAIDAPPQGFSGCVYCNPALAGYGVAMAQWTAVDDDGANNAVGVVGDPSIAAHQQSGKATTEELKRLMPDADIEQVEVSFAKTPQANTQTVVAALQRNPDMKYLVYQSPDLLGGVEQALSAAGLAETVKVVAPGPTTGEELLSVKDGFPTVWITTGGSSYYWDTVDMIARHLVGDDFEPVPSAPTGLVTPENASADLITPPNYEDSYMEAWGVK